MTLLHIWLHISTPHLVLHISAIFSTGQYCKGTSGPSCDLMHEWHSLSVRMMGVKYNTKRALYDRLCSKCNASWHFHYPSLPPASWECLARVPWASPWEWSHSARPQIISRSHIHLPFSICHFSFLIHLIWECPERPAASKGELCLTSPDTLTHPPVHTALSIVIDLFLYF